MSSIWTQIVAAIVVAVVTAALGSYATIKVLDNDISWIRVEVRHQNVRIMDLDHRVTRLETYCITPHNANYVKEDPPK